MGAYRTKLSDELRTRIYSDNDDILKRSDSNQEPIRAATWQDAQRTTLEKSNELHVAAIQALYQRFEQEHRLPAGMGAHMLLNIGMGL